MGEKNGQNLGKINKGVHTTSNVQTKLRKIKLMNGTGMVWNSSRQLLDQQAKHSSS